DRGRSPSHDLFDRGLHEFRIRAQTLKLFGVLDQSEQPSRYRTASGLRPCGKEQVKEGTQLLVVELWRTIVQLRVNTDRQNIIGRFRALFLDQLVGVGAQAFQVLR